MKDLEMLTAVYNCYSEQITSKVEDILLACWKTIDLAYLWGYKQAKTGPDKMAWDKWEDETKNYFVGLWEKIDKFKNEDQLIGAIRSKYGMSKRKKNLWDIQQRKTKYEYDSLRSYYDKEGKMYEPLDLLVSSFPQPDEYVNRKMLKEYIDELGEDIKALRDYVNGEGKISKQLANHYKKIAKKRLEHLV